MLLTSTKENGGNRWTFLLSGRPRVRIPAGTPLAKPGTVDLKRFSVFCCPLKKYVLQKTSYLRCVRLFLLVIGFGQHLLHKPPPISDRRPVVLITCFKRFLLTEAGLDEKAKTCARWEKGYSAAAHTLNMGYTLRLHMQSIYCNESEARSNMYWTAIHSVFPSSHTPSKPAWSRTMLKISFSPSRNW